MSEQKKRYKGVGEKRVISREEVYHGALEDILLGRVGGGRDYGEGRYIWGWGGVYHLLGVGRKLLGKGVNILGGG